MEQKRKFFVTGALFASPWVIGFVIFSLYPIVASFYFSLTEYNVLQPAVFVGLNNYKELFTEAKFFKSLYNTLYMCVFGVPLNLVFALAMALLLNLEVKGQAIYRTIYYLPSVISVVASAVIWIWVLHPEYGLLNTTLGALGLPQPVWLADPVYTKPSLIMMGMWGSGGTMIIYLAALKGVPKSLYEAAELDGAGPWKKFTKITIPAISTATLFQLVIGLIHAFQYFTQAFIFIEGTNHATMPGGPENSLLFYAIYLYQQAFSYLKFGTASAMAWILFIIIVIVTVIVFRTSLKWVYYGGE